MDTDGSKTTAVEEDRATTDDIELLSFQIADHEYCIDIMAVREIRGWTRATSLPHAPEFVHGVINLRGVVLPVIDLARRLDIPAEPPSERSVVIVVDFKGRTVGVQVDGVSDILTVPKTALQSPPEIRAETAERFVEAILVLDDRMVRVLDLNAILPSVSDEAA
ncbi:MAG: chemotaxis protein CheW [Pseudomonadota bacterium]